LIFDERDLPWTIRLSLGWTIILALTSAGLLFIPLGLYLAYWARTRRGHSAAFWCYTGVTMISILLLVPGMFSARSEVAVAGVGLVLLLAAPHVLRAEIISLYLRSWKINLPISHFLTFLFSSVYLNYSIPDLPVAPFDAISPQGVGPFRNSSGSGEL
jgi:hypothetical protein